MLKKKIINFILLFCLICFCGCEVHPREVITSFLNAVENKNLNQAGKFCNPTLRESLKHFPSAFQNYKYGIIKIDFKFEDLQKTKEGFLALVQVKVLRNEPPPFPPYIPSGLLSLHLKKYNDKWYINSIDIKTQNVEYNKKPLPGIKPKRFEHSPRPFWEKKEMFSGSISNFIFKYDKYCREWNQ